MARVICCTIVALTLLLLSASAYSVDVNDAHGYVLLIKDVHTYYGTTCIIIIHSDSSSDFNQTSYVYVWSRALSRQGILTAITSFSELPGETRKHQGYLSRPLYVVILATKETMDEFSTVTRQIDISFPVWLVMFLPYMDNPMRNVCRDPAGNPFHLLFDTEMLVLCYEYPLLREWYSLSDNSTRTFDLASWQLGLGLSLRTNLSLYERRNNMFGKAIRVSVVEDSMLVALKDGVLSKYLGEVIRELSKSINFTIEVVSFMPTYGSWNKEEEIWTGVIGEIATKRAEFGVAEFSITNHRLDAVDFTLPLILSGNKIYFKKPDGSAVQWSGYFKTFHMDVWLAIVCLIVTAPIFLTIIKTRGRIKLKILADNYMHVWGIYCQQGLSDFPNESSMRLAFLSIFLSALIILSAYSASLISFLTVSTVSLPFSTLEEFSAYGSYKLIVFKNSADYDRIISANDSVISKLKKFMKNKQDLPLTVHDAFTQVCNEKVGFYVTEVIKKAFSGLPCETVYIDAGWVDSLALVLNKGSQYTGIVNYHLQRFVDNGILYRLRSTYFVVNQPRDKEFTIVTLGGIAPILSVLASGILLGCLVLLLEKVYHNLCGKTLKLAGKRGEVKLEPS